MITAAAVMLTVIGPLGETACLGPKKIIKLLDSKFGMDHKSNAMTMSTESDIRAVLNSKDMRKVIKNLSTSTLFYKRTREKRTHV